LVEAFPKKWLVESDFTAPNRRYILVLQMKTFIYVPALVMTEEFVSQINNKDKSETLKR
jgi:hypothetical protein